MSDNASRNRCRARTWGGTTIAGAGLKNLLLSQLEPAVAAEITTTIPTSHQTHAQLFGISTGGLIPRISFVPPSCLGGTTNAVLLELRGIPLSSSRTSFLTHHEEFA